MLKAIGLSNKPALGKNNGNRLISEKNNSDSEVNRFGGNNVEYAKKLGKLKALKLSKSRKSKSENSAKSKKPSKSDNFPNFSAKEAEPSFTNSNARTVFNYLWLAFTEASIL